MNHIKLPNGELVDLHIQSGHIQILINQKVQFMGLIYTKYENKIMFISNNSLSREEFREYQYLQSKHIFDKNLDENEQNRYDELQEKYVKECEYKFHFSEYIKEKEHRQQIINKIKPQCKFKSTFVKGCISKQTGEYYSFYDVEIVSYPPVHIYDSKINYEIDKYNKLRGRSKNLSIYAINRQSLAEYHYIMNFFLPALQEAYEDYLNEHFCGKEGEYDGIHCKKFQIDWFNKIFITDGNKIETAFQKWIKDIEAKYNERYRNLFSKKLPELESWERAWIDSVEYKTQKQFYYFCRDLMKCPEKHLEGIKNPKEYLQEAGKIIGRKLI